MSPRDEHATPRTPNRRSVLRLGLTTGIFGGLIGGFTTWAGPAPVAMAESTRWRHYPTRLYDFEFPAIEGVTRNGTDTWYTAGFVTGQESGRDFAFITIFCKNRPVDVLNLVRADFYTFALFDLQAGEYGTYTVLDFPPAGFLTPPRLHLGSGHLDLAADTPDGRATWTTRRTAGGALDPFRYHLDLRGADQHGRRMSLDVDLDPMNPLTAAGGDTTRGLITCFAQRGTGTYFQTGTHFRGTLTWGDIREPVVGTRGHIDRQFFPRYAGVHAGPTSRDNSHEWRSVNLDDGSDLSIWRQFDRTNRNALQPFTGSTRYVSTNDSTRYSPTVEVDYSSYVRWPSAVSTYVPPPAQGRWLPSAHTLRVPEADIELRCDPLVRVPAHGLPVEYMIGPAHWEGHIAGRPVRGVGFTERTLALYRDWELADVLRVNVRHLPSEAYSPSSPSPTQLRALAEQVAKAADRSDKLTMVARIRTGLDPAIASLRQPARAELDRLLRDMEVAPGAPPVTVAPLRSIIGG